MVRVYGHGEQVVVTYLKELSPRLLEERWWTKSRGISAPCGNSSAYYHCTALTVLHNKGNGDTQCDGSIQCPLHFGPLYIFFSLYCVCVIFKQRVRCPAFLILLRNISDYEILSMYINVGFLPQSQILTLNKVTDFLQMRYAQNIHMPLVIAWRPFKFLVPL